MKLRNVNYENQVKKLKRSLKELSLDLDAILKEHNQYRLEGSDEEVLDWFQSLPIETLRESCDREHNKPRTRYSLHDMKHKFALRRLHKKKISEMERKSSELKVAKINCILEKIGRIPDV